MSTEQHTPFSAPTPSDSTLVAWIDGEVDAATTAQIATAIKHDPELEQRARLLRYARGELAFAMTNAATPAAPSSRLRPQSWWPALAGAAALLVVVLLAIQRSRGGKEATENDHLRIELSSPRSGWGLFRGICFDLTGSAKSGARCRIVAPRDNESDIQAARRAIREAAAAAPASNATAPTVDAIPLALEAVLEGTNCDGRKLEASGPVRNIEHTFGDRDSRTRIQLVDVDARSDGIAPVVAVRLDENSTVEDFDWALRRGIEPGRERHGFLPQEPGSWRIRLRLRALPTAPDKAPAFAEPLEVALGFVVQGLAGEWSKPFDGLSARVVANTQSAGSTPLVLGLQLRNDCDRARSYNVTGSTQANIPQPFHFDLLVDGAPWHQRKGLAVRTAATSLGLSQPPQTRRSIVVMADSWRNGDGKAPSSLSGRHRIAIRFHSEALIWMPNDRKLWQGKLHAPGIEVDFGTVR